MQQQSPLHLPTIILRHRKENLKKCSLRGLEGRDDFRFFTYPIDQVPSLKGYLMLAVDAPPLTEQDKGHGLFLIDATWRYAGIMLKQLQIPTADVEVRSLPRQYRTAYPRRQDDCPQPEYGLASIEAIYIAHLLLGMETQGLLDNYYWKESFLNKNFLSP